MKKLITIIIFYVIISLINSREMVAIFHARKKNLLEQSCARICARKEYPVKYRGLCYDNCMCETRFIYGYEKTYSQVGIYEKTRN